MTVAAGETVLTDQEGNAAFDLVPGIVIELNPNTTVTIEELFLTKTSHLTFFMMDSRKAVIRVLRGSIHGFVAPSLANSSLEAHVGDAAVVATQDSCFFLEAAERVVHITVAAGKVSLHGSSGSSVDLTDGYFEQWQPGQGNAFGRPVVTDCDPTVRLEADRACELARHFSELLGATADRLPAAKTAK
jgi:hypothetical protein